MRLLLIAAVGVLWLVFAPALMLFEWLDARRVERLYR